jgi:hypothetical protein
MTSEPPGALESEEAGGMASGADGKAKREKEG